MEILRAELNYSSNVKPRSKNNILGDFYLGGSALDQNKIGSAERVADGGQIGRPRRYAGVALLAFCNFVRFSLLYAQEWRKCRAFEQSICLLIAPNRLPSPRHR